MGAVDLDGASIEKRDFPVARRGYEPAAVDAHLRSVAIAVAELNAKARQGESVGAAAATQVQGILDAAQAAAEQIVGDAQEQAARAVREAELAAQRTRSEAIAAAQAHLAALAKAAATLRGRVESMDGDLHGLAETLRSGGARLAQELSAVDRDMAALYDAASGRRPAAQAQEPQPTPTSGLPLPSDPPEPLEMPAPPEPVQESRPPAVEPVANGVAGETPALPADLDGARLIALNMALNGDSRETTDRYLEQYFNLPEREKLIDEVYAAIEG
jgi:hypothetical protein